MIKAAFTMISAFLIGGGNSDLPSYEYVELPLGGAQHIRVLESQGWDIGGINLERNTVSIIVPSTRTHLLEGMPIVRRTLARRPDTKFKSPAEVKAALFALEGKYPQLVAIHVIGQSVEGLDIYAAEVTARFVMPSSGTKPTVLFDSMHHAREIMTPEVTLDIVEHLAEQYKKDPKVNHWLNTYVVWVVPMVNPDGNRKVWGSNSMWRKNTRGGYGVDINRNYPADWNACNGSSGNKNSPTYRGPTAGSEPETTVLMDLATRIKPKFNISYHSYSEIVIYPYGCKPKKIPQPDRDEYEGIGWELARKLVRDSGNGTYTAGTAYELLYSVDGGSVDWMYDREGIFSFVVEVNSSSQGFHPSFDKWRDSTVMKQRVGWKYILDQMDKHTN